MRTRYRPSLLAVEEGSTARTVNIEAAKRGKRRRSVRSRIILSIARGPRQVRMTSATVYDGVAGQQTALGGFRTRQRHSREGETEEDRPASTATAGGEEDGP
jgi:hypothetical protein